MSTSRCPRWSAELHEVRGTIEERDELRARVQAALAEARVTLAARQSQHEALERLEREREGYGTGVRAVFAAAGTELPGIVGTVADLLEVPVGLEAAVESVLGDRLQWVVFERFAEARAAVAFLEREGAGSATFLPLETLPPWRRTRVVTTPAPALETQARTERPGHGVERRRRAERRALGARSGRRARDPSSCAISWTASASSATSTRPRPSGAGTASSRPT